MYGVIGHLIRFILHLVVVRLCPELPSEVFLQFEITDFFNFIAELLTAALPELIRPCCLVYVNTYSSWTELQPVTCPFHIV